MPRKPKPGQDLYNTLGVSKDATPQEIKKARRKKAAQSHPDVGGDHDHMAEINHAYDVLIDPERRRLYDATGTEERQTSLEDEVRNLLLMVFQEALQSESPQMLKRARSLVEANQAKAKEQRQEITKRLDKLRKRRSLITVKAGDNLFAMLCDQQIQAAEAALNSYQHGEDVCKAALKALQQYESAEPNIYDQVIDPFEIYRTMPFPGWRQR